MTGLTGADFAALFRAVAAAMEAEKDHLSALDGAIGDGDHGVTMSTGFQAVQKALDGLAEDAAPADVLNAAAKTFLNAVGASAGPLYATGLMRAGAAVKGRDSVDAAAMADVIDAMAEGIAQRGKAELGQKTMLDAWRPAAEAALAAKAGGAIGAVVEGAAKAARKGAEATAAMMPGKGRSANLGERAVGHVDPGAASAALILEAMARWAGARED